MKRLVIAIFAVVAAALAASFLWKSPEEESGNAMTRARTVVPVSHTEQREAAADDAQYAEDTALVSLVPLRSDETLLNTLGIDFDGDGYDDQINAIRRTTSPYIVLLVGLYNPFRGQYDRTTEIRTEIIQTQTFSFTCMDIIGNHTNALVYTGFLEDGSSVMRIFLPQRSGTDFTLPMIGDFRSDGSIFIQQLDRYDSYEAQQAAGVSFPVWVYSSDTSRGGGTLDQLQTMYVWDQGSGGFVKSTETRVAETKVTSKELSRIQDGTVETFANHLAGLWYKTSSSDDGIRYIFFSPDEKEIIFQTSDSQEVYTWVASTLRRNGIYLSAVNSSINNLTRRIDISLTGIDEVKISNQDDVRMPIKESNLWDGQYKKQTGRNALLDSAKVRRDVIATLESRGKWIADGTTEIEFADGGFTLNSQQGRTASSVCGEHLVVQLRGTTEAPFFGHESYIATVEDGEDASVRLTPVRVTPLSVEAADLPDIMLEAVQEEES